MKVGNNPIKLSKSPAEFQTGASDLGQHTDAIMKGMGYAEAEIAKMREAGIIA